MLMQWCRLCELPLGQAKLAKLRRELLDPAAGGGGGGGGRGDGFDVNKVGDARVGLVGELTPEMRRKQGNERRHG